VVFGGYLVRVGYWDGPSPSNDVSVRGKMGRIHSIMIEGKGQFFPLSGEFNDGSIKVVDSTTDVLDVDVKVEKKKRAKKSSE